MNNFIVKDKTRNMMRPDSNENTSKSASITEERSQILISELVANH